MRVRVITLAYSEGLNGFPEEPLRQATFGQEILEVRDHFFVHGGKPHLVLVILLGEGSTAAKGQRTEPQAEDPGKSLPEELRPLYRALRQWRNDRARSEGIPSYLVLRNAQLAEICRRLPRSLAALREIEGIGERTCEKYGAELLALLPGEAKRAWDEEPTAGVPRGPAPLDAGSGAT